ncbi:MAG: hypothetical protein ACJASP_000303 [Roseivirga sp.]|jgi:hypothetical protein
MSLTTAQHDLLVKYLKDVGIKHQEPFEEFYDHIATGFEKSHVFDLDTYIGNVSEPAFGGTKGMLKIVNEQNKIRKSMIWKRAKEIFIGLFGWPAIGFVMASFILVQFGSQLFGQKFIIVFSLGIGLVTPLFVAGYGCMTFYRQCRKQKLPYTSSNLNAWLIFFISFPISFVNLGVNGVIPHIIGRETFKTFLSAYPVVTICLSTLVLLFGFTCLKLFKENFTFKLELK